VSERLSDATLAQIICDRIRQPPGFRLSPREGALLASDLLACREILRSIVEHERAFDSRIDYDELLERARAQSEERT